MGEIPINNKMENQEKTIKRLIWETFLKNDYKAHKNSTTVSCIEMSGEFKHENKTFKFEADLDIHFDEVKQ